MQAAGPRQHKPSSCVDPSSARVVPAPPSPPALGRAAQPVSPHSIALPVLPEVALSLLGTAAPQAGTAVTNSSRAALAHPGPLCSSCCVCRAEVLQGDLSTQALLSCQAWFLSVV